MSFRNLTGQGESDTGAAGFGGEKLFHHLVTAPVAHAGAHLVHPPWLVWVASAAAFVGIGVAVKMYLLDRRYTLARRRAHTFSWLYTTMLDKFYIDVLYQYMVHRILFAKIAATVKWFDRAIVDAAVHRCGSAMVLGGKYIRKLQNGQLQFYAATLVAAGVLLFYWGSNFL